MKLIVCDVEGTIFKAKYRIEGTDYASTMWQPIAHRLGPEAEKEEKETHRKWENGEYKVKDTNRNNYIKWVEETIEIHRKYNLTKDVFYQLIDSAEYNDGVVEFFNNLNRDLYIPVLISGGFQELIRRAQSDFKIYYGYGACEYIWDKDDHIVSWSLKPSDFENKYDYVKLILSNYNLNEAKDWIFIGDGKNDSHIASRAPISFAINPHVELASTATYTIDSFSEIMKLLESDEIPMNFSKRRGISNRQSFLIGQRLLNMGKEYENGVKCVQSNHEDTVYQFYSHLKDYNKKNSGIIFRQAVEIVLKNISRYLDSESKVEEFNSIIENNPLSSYSFDGNSSISVSYYEDSVNVDRWALKLSSPDFGTYFRQPIAGCRFNLEVALSHNKTKDNVSIGVMLKTLKPSRDYNIEVYRPLFINELSDRFTYYRGEIPYTNSVLKYKYNNLLANSQFVPILLFKNEYTFLVDTKKIASALFTFALVFVATEAEFKKILTERNVKKTKIADYDRTNAEVVIFYPDTWHMEPNVYYTDDVLNSNDSIVYDDSKCVVGYKGKVEAFEINVIDKVIREYKENAFLIKNVNNELFYDQLHVMESERNLEKAGRLQIEKRVESILLKVNDWERRYGVNFNEHDKKIISVLKVISLNSVSNITKYTGCSQLLVDGELALSLLKTAILENEESNKVISGAVLQPFANAVEVFIKGKVLLALSKQLRINYVQEMSNVMFGVLSSFLKQNIANVNYIGNIDYLISDMLSFSKKRGEYIAHNCLSVDSTEIDKQICDMYNLIENANRILK